MVFPVLRSLFYLNCTKITGGNATAVLLSVLIFHLHEGIHKVDIWKVGGDAKSRPSSFASVTWWVAGCIVCWTRVIAFVERLTENTQCGAGPCLTEIVSVLVENPEGPTFSKLTSTWTTAGMQLRHPTNWFKSPWDWPLGCQCHKENQREKERESTGSLILPAPLQWNRILFPRAPSTNTVSLTVTSLSLSWVD